MKSKQTRRYPWMILLALLVIGFVACGDVPQAGNIWDSGRFDQNTWQ